MAQTWVFMQASKTLLLATITTITNKMANNNKFNHSIGRMALQIQMWEARMEVLANGRLYSLFLIITMEMGWFLLVVLARMVRVFSV